MLKVYFACFLVSLMISIGTSILNDSVLKTEEFHFEIDFINVRKLPRFWTNTGFCPPAPTNDSTTLAEFFLSEKTQQNMEYISALPNNGLKFIRIHWLINLIKFV